MKKPIGVFDSGVGGLTVLRALRKSLPAEDFIYVGDTARVPWGNRGEETIVRFSLEVSRFLEKMGVGFLVVACHTASTIALGEIKRQSGVPVLGVMEPEFKHSWEKDSKRVGLLGTAATVNQGKWQRVLAVACPLLVPLVEEGWFDHPVTEMVVRHYVQPLKEKKVDKLVLACTHYPFLEKVITKVMGPKVELVNPACLVAQKLTSLIPKNKNRLGKETLYFTDINHRAINFLAKGAKIKKVTV